MKNKHLRPLKPATLDTMFPVTGRMWTCPCPPAESLKDYARANGCSLAREYVNEAESGHVADRCRLGEIIEEGTKPNAPFEVTLVWEFSGFIGKREHALAIEPCSSTMGIDRATYVDLQRLTSSCRTSNSGDCPSLRNPAFPLGHCVGILRPYLSFDRSLRMGETAAMPISGPGHAHRTSRRGRRSFGAYYRWVDDALRHHADGYRLLDSALIGLPGVQRLARQRFRRSAFAGVNSARALLQQAIERASAILTPRQVLALQLYCEGRRMVAIAARLGLRSRQHLWAAYRRPAVEAVTREFLALAQAEFPAN